MVPSGPVRRVVRVEAHPTEICSKRVLHRRPHVLGDCLPSSARLLDALLLDRWVDRSCLDTGRALHGGRMRGRVASWGPGTASTRDFFCRPIRFPLLSVAYGAEHELGLDNRCGHRHLRGGLNNSLRVAVAVVALQLEQHLPGPR